MASVLGGDCGFTCNHSSTHLVLKHLASVRHCAGSKAVNRCVSCSMVVDPSDRD